MKLSKRFYITVGVIVAATVAICALLRFLPQDTPTQPAGTASVAQDSGDYVEMIDVGQGDCTLVHAENANMLIDCGESEYADSILTTLKNNGISSLDLVIISHPHTDHMGALPKLLKSIPISAVLIDTTADDSDETAVDRYNSIIDTCEEKGVQLLARDEYSAIDLGPYQLTLLPEYPTPDDINDRSIVIRMTYGNNAFLFTGDMTKNYESYLLKQHADVSCNVLKAAHHGSRYSNSAAFLKATGASIALIGCGEGNSYGHPHKQAVKRMTQRNMTLYQTDRCGNIRINAATLDVQTAA